MQLLCGAREVAVARDRLDVSELTKLDPVIISLHD
jgi:hypothetical protein